MVKRSSKPDYFSCEPFTMGTFHILHVTIKTREPKCSNRIERNQLEEW